MRILSFTLIALALNLFEASAEILTDQELDQKIEQIKMPPDFGKNDGLGEEIGVHFKNIESVLDQLIIRNDVKDATRKFAFLEILKSTFPNASKLRGLTYFPDLGARLLKPDAFNYFSSDPKSAAALVQVCQASFKSVNYVIAPLLTRLNQKGFLPNYFSMLKIEVEKLIDLESGSGTYRFLRGAEDLGSKIHIGFQARAVTDYIDNKLHTRKPAYLNFGIVGLFDALALGDSEAKTYLVELATSCPNSFIRRLAFHRLFQIGRDAIPIYMKEILSNQNPNNFDEEERARSGLAGLGKIPNLPLGVLLSILRLNSPFNFEFVEGLYMEERTPIPRVFKAVSIRLSEGDPFPMAEFIDRYVAPDFESYLEKTVAFPPHNEVDRAIVKKILLMVVDIGIEKGGRYHGSEFYCVEGNTNQGHSEEKIMAMFNPEPIQGFSAMSMPRSGEPYFFLNKFMWWGGLRIESSFFEPENLKRWNQWKSYLIPLLPRLEIDTTFLVLNTAALFNDQDFVNLIFSNSQVREYLEAYPELYRLYDLWAYELTSRNR
jgi:hypothetical protein